MEEPSEEPVRTWKPAKDNLPEERCETFTLPYPNHGRYSRPCKVQFLSTRALSGDKYQSPDNSCGGGALLSCINGLTLKISESHWINDMEVSNRQIFNTALAHARTRGCQHLCVEGDIHGDQLLQDTVNEKSSSTTNLGNPYFKSIFISPETFDETSDVGRLAIAGMELANGQIIEEELHDANANIKKVYNWDDNTWEDDPDYYN